MNIPAPSSAFIGALFEEILFKKVFPHLKFERLILLDKHLLWLKPIVLNSFDDSVNKNFGRNYCHAGVFVRLWHYWCKYKNRRLGIETKFLPSDYAKFELMNYLLNKSHSQIEVNTKWLNEQFQAGQKSIEDYWREPNVKGNGFCEVFISRKNTALTSYRKSKKRGSDQSKFINSKTIVYQLSGLEEEIYDRYNFYPTIIASS